jgi:hypothetical protein
MSATTPEQLWVAIATAAIWLLASITARQALSGDQEDWRMPQHPARPPPRHPYLIMNLKSGGGKVEKFDLKRKAEALGAEVFLVGGSGHIDVAEVARKAISANRGHRRTRPPLAARPRPPRSRQRHSGQRPRGRRPLVADPGRRRRRVGTDVDPRDLHSLAGRAVAPRQAGQPPAAPTRRCMNRLSSEVAIWPAKRKVSPER